MANANTGYNPNVELPKDPNFVRTWDLPAEPTQGQYRPPIVDPPYEAPQQPRPLAEVRQGTLDQQPVEVQQQPSLGSRTIQSFEEFSAPFLQQQQQTAPQDPSPYYDLFNKEADFLKQMGVNNATAAQTAKDAELASLQKDFDTYNKQLEESYNPKVEALKQFLSDRGILDSSTSGVKQLDLIKQQQDAVVALQDNFNKQKQSINTLYNQRVAGIQQEMQRGILDQQNLLQQRLDKLASDKRVSEDNKLQFQYQIYSDYQDSLDAIDAQQRQARLDEYAMQQDAIQNALNQAKFEYDKQFETDKFEYAKQQDAIALQNKGSGGGGGGSASYAGTSSEVEDYLATIYNTVKSSGLPPEDAKNSIIANLPTKLKAAINTEFYKRINEKQNFLAQDDTLAALINRVIGASVPGSSARQGSTLTIDPMNRKTSEVVAKAKTPKELVAEAMAAAMAKRAAEGG